MWSHEGSRSPSTRPFQVKAVLRCGRVTATEESLAIALQVAMASNPSTRPDSVSHKPDDRALLGNGPDLNEVGYIQRHFLDCGVVEGLNVAQNALILCCDEVDCNSLAAKATSTPNPERQKVKI